MRTNIVIDETLMERAIELSGLKTKKAVVHEALTLYIQLLNQRKFPTQRKTEMGRTLKKWNKFDDPSSWIDFFNGKETSQTEKLEKLLYTDLTEVLRGFNFRRLKTAKKSHPASLSTLPRNFCY